MSRDPKQLAGANQITPEQLETLTRAQLPLPELYKYLLDYYFSEVEAETAFRAEAKRRNISQFATEKALKEIQSAANAASLDFAVRSGLDVYKDRATVEHIIPNLLLSGRVTLLHGHSGHGKTTFLKQAVYSLLTGENFLGRPVVKSDALIVELDEPSSETMETLIDKMGLPECDAARLDIVDELPDLKQGVESIKRYLRNHPNVRVVVVDALQNFCGVENMNDNSEVGNAMHKLRTITKEFKNIALAIIHHSNRNGGFLGAQAIKANVDLQYRFVMDETQDNTNFLIQEKWRVIPKQDDLCLNWDRAAYMFTIGSGHRDRRLSRANDTHAAKCARILDLLDENPNGLRQSALHQLVKGRWDTFAPALQTLMQTGQVEDQNGLLQRMRNDDLAAD
jgi:AAA domain